MARGTSLNWPVCEYFHMDTFYCMAVVTQYHYIVWWKRERGRERGDEKERERKQDAIISLSTFVHFTCDLHIFVTPVISRRVRNLHRNNFRVARRRIIIRFISRAWGTEKEEEGRQRQIPSFPGAVINLVNSALGFIDYGSFESDAPQALA